MDRSLLVAIPTMVVASLIVILFFNAATSTDATKPNHDLPAAPLETSSEARLVQSPFNVVRTNFLGTGDSQARSDFDALLQQYRSEGASKQRKSDIAKELRVHLQSVRGQKLMIEALLSPTDRDLAEVAYRIIRDADIRDIALLERLIQHDLEKTAITNSRIVDLIADASVANQARYSHVIDRYLAQLERNSDQDLRRAAASQRIWYLAQHQPNNLAALSGYLLDRTPSVREEMYSLIEMRVEAQSESSVASLTPTLDAALRADHLGMSAAEKTRATTLLHFLKSRS